MGTLAISGLVRCNCTHASSFLYKQLLEWVRVELVPAATPQKAAEHGQALVYRGDTDDFLRQMEGLYNAFPQDTDELIESAADPLGREFLARLDTNQQRSRAV